RPDGRAAVAVPDRERPSRQPDDLQRRRTPVHRRTRRLGRMGRRIPCRDVARAPRRRIVRLRPTGGLERDRPTVSTTQLATPQLDYKQLDYKQLDYKQLDYNTEEEPEMEPVVARTERPEWKK